MSGDTAQSGAAAEPAVRYLGDVQRLELRPGDIVVLKVPGNISCEQIARMRDIARAELPGHKVLVLDGGVSIGVMGGRE